MKKLLFPSRPDLRLGSFYILAPENACASTATFDLTDFEEVFQYGSAEAGTPDPDPPFRQDGIAPQCPVKGLSEQEVAKNPAISDQNKNNYGRAFYPKNKPKLYPRGFYSSHSVLNYKWILGLSKQRGDRGEIIQK